MLNFCSRTTLENHGESMVIKIREIATSLLEEGVDEHMEDREQGLERQGEKGIEERTGSQEHLMESFLGILVSLDYANRQANI